MKIKQFLLISFTICAFIVLRKGSMLTIFKRAVDDIESDLVKSDDLESDDLQTDSETGMKFNHEADLNDIKKILLWTEFYNMEYLWNILFRRMEDCEENRCKFTLNRMETINVDAVLFNAYNLRDIDHLDNEWIDHVIPLPFQFTRNPNQIYILYSNEPPTKMDDSYLASIPKNYFNWTMSYRRDSDVFEPFGVVVKRSEKKTLRSVTQNELRMKKLAIWIGSSCNQKFTRARDQFLKDLRREITVETFGNCGMHCDGVTGSKMYGKIVGGQACEWKVNNYVFYLALENSLCKDYITEKIFKAWRLGAIPVVFGSGNYSTFAPTNSYIDYRDFDSVSEFANYMKKIASDATLYNQYFKWKEEYDVEVGSPYRPMICDLCKKLHSDPTQRKLKWYPDIHDWFIRQGDCKNYTKI